MRTRTRWAQKLEDELIRSHREGKPPNMCEFGCTQATGQKILEAALKGKEDVKQTKPAQ